MSTARPGRTILVADQSRDRMRAGCQRDNAARRPIPHARGYVRPGLSSVLVLPLLAFGAAGCAFRVTPPVAVESPTAVFVVDYGAHAGLVLPREDASVVEYAYGEWGWFARNEQQWYRAPAIMLCPSDGALGMRPLVAGANADDVAEITRPQRIHQITVDRDCVRRLLERLDHEFNAGGEPEFNPVAQMLFVPSKRKYCACTQCNTLVAEWLHELECRVDGGGIWADFLIAPR